MIKKILLRIHVGFLLVMSNAFAQTPAPAFEVASIKPSAPLNSAAMIAGTAHVGTRIDNARVDIGMTPLFRLICVAYRVRPYQVSGPDWLKTTMFDVQAKIPEGIGPDKVPEMLRALLTDRFGLKVHLESKDQPVYALIVAPGGPKLKESQPAPATPATPAPAPTGDGSKAGEKAPPPMNMAVPTAQGDVQLTKGPEGISIEMPGGEISGKLRITQNRGTGSQPMRLHLESSNTTMKSFAEMLSVGVVNRPVVDVTGLTGRYEVAVDISQDDAMNVARASVSYLMNAEGGGQGSGTGGAASDPAGSSIFTSIQNLGLKLDPRKMPLDLLVIDHAEKTPTAN